MKGAGLLDPGSVLSCKDTPTGSGSTALFTELPRTRQSGNPVAALGPSRKLVCGALHWISALRSDSLGLARFGTKAPPPDVAGVDEYALGVCPAGASCPVRSVLGNRGPRRLFTRF